MIVSSVKEANEKSEIVRNNANKVFEKIRKFDGSPMDFIFNAKFNTFGFHPISSKPLNLIEQLNQSFTFIAAFEAAKKLFEWHELPNGLLVFPGAHAPKGSLDLEANELPGYLGAETFASVRPNNNGKLKADLVKLSKRPERYRYSFFISPLFPESKRQKELEIEGVQVWSLWPF